MSRTAISDELFAKASVIACPIPLAAPVTAVTFP
jgi:hypothetical protein